MDAIKALFNELRRYEILNDCKAQFSYNGITIEDSSMAFQKRLHRLYEDALVEIPFLSKETKAGFVYVIDRYSESQDNFDVPDESILRSINGNVDLSHINERDFVTMIGECVSLQKSYLEKFATAIGYNLVTACDDMEQVITNELKSTTSTNNNLIKGVKGLASFLGCGITTAQNIINSKVLEMGNAQYRAGKGWLFRKDKLIAMLEKEPELLKSIKRK